MTVKPDLSKKEVVKKLKPAAKPYWHRLAKGLSIGYYFPGTGTQSWIARVWAEDAYRFKTLEVDTFPRAAEEAGLWARQVRDGNAPTATEVTNQSLTVKEAINRYVESDEMRVEKGDRYDRWKAESLKYANAYAIPNLGRIRLRNLTAEDIRGNQIHLLTKVSPETVKRGTVSLRAALNWAHRKGWATSAPWKEVPLPEEREQHQKTRLKEYVSQADRDAFLEAADASLRAICEGMELTGARPSELRRLRVRDVKPDHVLLMTFKGNRNTGTSRKFPLTNGRLAFFQAQAEGRDPDEFLFLTEKGRQWSIANLAKSIKKYRGELPLESYSWRHCFLTDKVAAGVNTVALAKLCGTSESYILRNYTTDLDLAEMLEGV